MKALVYAGGDRSRLRPVCHTMAPELVPVAGRPVLFHCLEAIAAAGIGEVVVVVPTGDRQIRRAVGDGARFGLAVRYRLEEAPLGLGHALLLARDALGDDDVVVHRGDTVVLGGIRHLIEEFRYLGPAALVLAGKARRAGAGDVAVVGPDRMVVEFAEAGEDGPGELALTGVYVFTPAIHQAVLSIPPDRRGERRLTEAMGRLIEHGHVVGAQLFTGFWSGTGRVEDLLECNQALLTLIRPAFHGEIDASTRLRGRVVVEPGARVIRSRIAGPTLIGADAVVVDSTIGPYTSIGSDCVLEYAEIGGSIVLDGARVSGVRRIQHSLIGRDAEVMPAPSAGLTQRLVIGDHSKVAIRT